MYICTVFNVWSNNSSYRVEFNTHLEATEFRVYKLLDEFVSHVDLFRVEFGGC